jgi:hypothetical protein
MEYINIMEASRRLGISDKTIRRAIHVGKLAARYPHPNRCEIAISDLEAWRQPPAEQDATDGRLAELESRLQQLELQVQQLIDVQQVMPQSVARPSPVEQKQKPRATREVSPLPDHLVPLQAFADQHFVNRNEAERLWKMGAITAVKGTWIVEKQRITVALDAKGRRDFWVQFHETQGFRACDDCPHK